MPTSTSDVVNQDEANQLSKVADYSTQQGNALGALRSFGDLLGDKARGQAQDATAIGQIGNNETGYANNVVPYQLTAASHSGDTARTLGDILALGGQVVGGVGATRNPTALSFLYGPTKAGSAAGFGSLLYPYAYGA